MHSPEVYQRLIRIKTNSYMKALFNEPVLGRRADLSIRFARDIGGIINHARENKVELYPND